MFYETADLKMIAKSRGKTCKVLFGKVFDLFWPRSENLTKKTLGDRCFPVNLGKSHRTPIASPESDSAENTDSATVLTSHMSTTCELIGTGLQEHLVYTRA